MSKRKIIIAVSQMDFSDIDCIIIFIMTHGGKKEVWAQNEKFMIENIRDSFKGDKCASLIGKPKIVLVQVRKYIN